MSKEVLIFLLEFLASLGTNIHQTGFYTYKNVHILLSDASSTLNDIYEYIQADSLWE